MRYWFKNKTCGWENKKNVFIIHGSYGSPTENWIPWLKTELEKQQCSAVAPRFPTPENQSLASWFAVFEAYKNQITAQTIFVGHSIGAAFVLNILEGLSAPVAATFCIAPFVSPLSNLDFDTINETFYSKKFDWEKIKKNCQKFYIFHSKNDPYVKREKAEELSQYLGTTITNIKNAGHFNAAAGYAAFPELLAAIKQEL